uniref:Cyclin-dependent kinases regulatory subunit n=1 Tax=Periophthalmus magnuspinnatus TaxID=409849 RepID=A0A3B4ASU0_9GOBI
MSKKQIYYSDKYTDDDFEYRHVVLPKQLAKLVPTSHLMTEEEWRGLGVQQSQGWMHYMVHKPGKFPQIHKGEHIDLLQKKKSYQMVFVLDFY